MKKFIFTFGFACLLVFSCSKHQSADYLSSSADLLHFSNSSLSIVSDQSKSLKDNVAKIVQANFYILEKIVSSAIPLDDIANTTEADLISENIFSSAELDSLMKILKNASAEIKEVLRLYGNDQECYTALIKNVVIAA